MDKVTAFQDPGYVADWDDSTEDVPESITESRTTPMVKAATVVGLQDFREGIWVFNKDVHINADGEPIATDTSPYVWLGKFYSSQQGYNSEALSVVKDNSLSANVALLLNDSANVHLIESLRCCYEENFPAALLILGSATFRRFPQHLHLEKSTAGRPLPLKLPSPW